jgi:5,10-methylene-tetrahydrofolate dehydrogenase/methenyl tetrahydrofolate cyclohydrolase
MFGLTFNNSWKSNSMAAFTEASATAKLIDGKAIAQTIREEIKEEVQSLVETFGKVPGLGVVLVGERKDSQTYVRMKKRACREVGIKSFESRLPVDVTQEAMQSPTYY